MASSSHNEDKARLPVCIIGAGAAGLAAASLLERHGRDYVILEGATRIGGRIYPFEHGDGFLQYGAQFVNGRANPIHDIAEREKLITATLGDYDAFEDFTEIRPDGVDITRKDALSFTSFTEDLEDGYCVLAEERPELSLKEAFQADYERYLKKGSRRERRAAFNAMARFYMSYYEMEWAARSENMALSNFSRWDDGIEGSDASFVLDKMGYKTILDDIASGVPEHKIRFNSTVANVDYSAAESVRVTLADGSTSEYSNVIVTVSLGVLKRHSSTLFTPELPARKHEAIQAIGFGDMQKLFLQYDAPFWKDEDWGIKTIGPPGCPLLGRGNVFDVVDWTENLLVLWMSGEAVGAAAKMSDDEISEKITKHFRSALANDSIPAPSKIMRHCWLEDPLVLGSYSYLMPESTRIGDANAVLAEPILAEDGGRPLVCFAGEATHSTIYQTVVGAFLSGEREAQRLLDSIH